MLWTGLPPLTRNLSSEVVGAHSNKGRVDSSDSSVGNSVTKGSVGGGNSSKWVSSIAKTIGVAISSIKKSRVSLGLSFSLPLLLSTGNSSTKVVGADSYIGGVCEPERSSSNSMDRVGDTSIAIGGIAKTMGSIGVGSIGTIESISLRLSISLPLLPSPESISTIEATIGIGVAMSSIASSAGDWHIGSIHTGGTLETSIGNREASITIGSIVGVSICLTVGSSHQGR